MYTQFYGFSKKPFNLTPDPAFFFVTPSQQEIISSLIYGIYERKGFISITGEVGTGKTTILHYLQTILDPKVKVVFIVQTHITFIQLLKEVLTDLKLPFGNETKSAMTRQLNTYLKQTVENGENLVIIIDEAQNLSRDVLEELRMLSNLETSENKLLQIVLVGQPELETKLNSEDLRQLKQRIGIRRQIKPLSEVESRAYIEHRLSRVGSAGKAVFTPEALSLICRYGQGVFRNINILCDNAFVIGYGLQKKTIDEAVVKEVLEDMGTLTPQAAERPKIVYNPEPILQESYEESQNSDEAESRPRSRFLNRKVSFGIAAAIGLVLVAFLAVDFRPDPPPQTPRPTPTPPNAGEKTAAVAPGTKSEPVQAEPSQPASEPKPAASEPAPPAPATAPEKPIQIEKEQKPAVAEPLKSEPAPAAPKPAGKPEKRFKSSIGLATGGTLYSIARQYYQEANISLVDCILEFNPKITDIHSISPHLKIWVPEIGEESFLLKSPDGSYKIILGTFAQPRQSRTYENVPELKGKTVEVVLRKVAPEETWYRVTAGKFETREEGLKTIQALKKRGLMPALKEK
jgi:general secretion pathway protein A